jgi:hypothetical protein
MAVLTVISWFAARRARRPLHELVQRALTSQPTLIAVVSDQYTNEFHIRPFAPIAERLSGRLEVILAAEWRQEDRLADGEALFRSLGLAPEVRPRLCTDEGEQRLALVVRQKHPIALIELFFQERGRFDDAREKELRALEDRAVQQLEELLVRLPPQPPPPPRVLQPGEHDFTAAGLCRLCSQARATLLPCAGTRREESPRRDRFELIELD